MGCLKLHIESEPILRLAYRKNYQKPQKKVGWYYPFGLKHKGYNNVVSSNGNASAQKFGFGGKELSEELGLNTYDFGARNYDPYLGRWMNVDPLASKYYDYSTYNYVANNPIIFKDPDGRKIIIGDNVKGAMTNLAQIAATKRGRAKLNTLISSRFGGARMKSIFFTNNSRFDPKGESFDKTFTTVYYPSSVWKSSIGGGSISSMLAMGHEIDHAHLWETNKGAYTRGKGGTRESKGVKFGNYLRSVYGSEKLRTNYRGSGLNLSFSEKESTYNSKNEKVTGFKELISFKAGGNQFVSHSYETSENGGENSTEYIIGATSESGKYNYVILKSKAEYEKRLKYIKDTLKKKKNEED